MALSIPDEGEEDILDVIFATTLVLRLFKNNLTPTNASVLSDFTEADFTGYAAITLTGGSWTTTPGAPSIATYVAQTFTCSAAGAAQTIYGYYITRTSSGRVWVAERFPAADIAAISAAGQTRIVNPRVTLKDESD